MRALGFSVAFVLSVSAACGGSQSSTTLSSSWKAPAILTHVPADSPYVITSLDRISDQMRARLTRGMDARLDELVKKLEAMKAEGSKHAPLARAALALIEEVRGKDPASWARALGFDPSGQFALYGLSLWPVMRISIADPARLRAVIDHVTAAAGASLRQATRDGKAYWTAGTPEVSLVAAVLEHEAVVALLPTAAVDAELPLVLGTQLPSPNLTNTTTIPDLLGKHRLLGYLAAYIDVHHVLDILSSPAQGPLDTPIHLATGPMAPDCRTDLLRLADLAPRVVFGYRKLDEVGFDGAMIAEAPASVTGPLGKLHTTASGVTAGAPSDALFTVGGAARPEDVVGLLSTVTKQLHDHPFTCSHLRGLTEAGDELARSLATPIPPMMRGLRGMSLVVDDATLMPPGVNGHLIVTGDLAQDFLSTLSAALPALAGIPVLRDGHAVPLPMAKLGVPLDSGHIAMTKDRVVVSAGANSAQRAERQVAAPLPARSPLFVMTFDTPRLQKLLASVGKPGMDGLDALGALAMSLDVSDAGVVFDFAGTWRDGAAIAK